MADDLLRKDLIAHKIYSAWQFIEYTEKNISTLISYLGIFFSTQ